MVENLVRISNFFDPYCKSLNFGICRKRHTVLKISHELFIFHDLLWNYSRTSYINFACQKNYQLSQKETKS